MAEALQVVVGVTSPLALAAVSLVVLRYVLARYWTHRERLIAAMPENERLAYFDDYLRRWGFDIANLNRTQKADIVRTEQKNRQSRLYFLGVCFFVLLAVTVICLVFSYIIGPLSGGKDGKEENNVALAVGLGFRGLFGAAGLALVLVALLRPTGNGTAKVGAVIIGGILLSAVILKPFKFESGGGKTTLSTGPPPPPGGPSK
jgi:hypothetical protein